MAAGLAEERAGEGVLFLTLDRPERRNALSDALIAALAARLESAAVDPDLRAVVLRGAGTVFCAGYDLRQTERHDPDALTRSTWTMLRLLRDMPVPTVALVDGPALGGGCALALACDRVVATEAAVFALPETRHGIVPALVLPFVVAAMGRRTAELMAVHGVTVDARRALEIGAIAEVVADVAALAARGDAIVRDLLSLKPGAVRATRTLVRSVADRTIGEDLFDELALASRRGRTSAEARAGIAAFRDTAAR